MRARMLLVALMLVLAAEETESVLSPFVFDDTKHGILDTDTARGIDDNENWAKIDMTDSLEAGDVVGFEYLRYNGGEFSIDLYNDDSTNLSPIDSTAIGVPAGELLPYEYQYICLATPITVEHGARYGVSAPDKTATTPAPWARAYGYNNNPDVVQYPCGEQLTSLTAHTVRTEDMQTNELVTVTVAGTEHNARIGVRPIMSNEFKYLCGCAVSDDCVEFDCNLECSGICECKAGWIYNGKHNRCVKDIANGKNISLSTDTASNAASAVDGSFSTCVDTDAEVYPWVVIDLGIAVDVYAVNVKIPIPQSQTVAVYSNKADDTTMKLLYPPSPWTPTSLVEKIVSTGPWPLLLTAVGNSDTVILNRDLAEDGGTFEFDVGDGFGTVTDTVGTIEILEQVGYIKSGDNCITVAASGTDAGVNNENCAAFYITGDSDVGFNIKLLSTDDSLKFLASAGGSAASLGDGTTFQFLMGDNNPITDVATALATAFTLAPSNVVGVTCVVISNSAVTLSIDADNDCVPPLLTFEVPSAIQAVASGYQFVTNAAVADDTSVTFTDTNAISPCVEIVEVGTANRGAAVVSKTDNENIVLDAFMMTSPDLVLDTTSLSVTARSTVQGISAFTIYVGSTFDGSTFNAATFETCTSFEGYPHHGDVDNIFACDAPKKGQYVAIAPTTKYGAPTPFSICEVGVHVASEPGLGSFCESDVDCQCPPSSSVDQHIHCNINVCECMSGYFIWPGSERCINDDECQVTAINPNNCEVTASANGELVSGTCVDTPGSFTCQCQDGYTYDADVGGGCADIDETAINNCGCEGTCVNKNTIIDMKKYECSCEVVPYGEGYQLADDDHTCEDVNECLNNALSTKCDADQTIGSGSCNNFPGGYSCNCPDYYKWHAESELCVARCDPDSSCGTTAGTANVDDLIKGTCPVDVGFEAWTCLCPDGYEYVDSAAETGCKNIYECAGDPAVHNCDHICADTPGSFTCSCHQGYYLADDNVLCLDIDECEESERTAQDILDYRCVNDPAFDSSFEGRVSPPICTNTVGDYMCSCDDGYTFLTAPNRCEDIAECSANNGGCEGGCANKNMIDDAVKYQCSCDEGLELNSNAHACDDVDECQDVDTHNCDDGSVNAAESDNAVTKALCRNVYATYECYCPPGWALNGGVCEDVDECTDRNPCEHGCQNTNGDFTCTCDTGFALLNDGRSCQDIDECATDADDCAQVCMNELGTFRCSCDAGYVLNADGAACDDVDECQTHNGRCQHICEDTEGSYDCSCDVTYLLMPDNHSCDDKDECEDTAMNDCEHICVNKVNGYDCMCNTGYELNTDGLTCDNVNECETNNGGCEGSCTDSEGSYECDCGGGFTLGENKHSCIDVNECLFVDDNRCDQICVNTAGSFQCTCDGGYQLASDLRQCVLGRMLRLNLCFNVPYKDVYASISAAESSQLASNIESYMAETMNGRSEIATTGNFEYQVTRFYPCPVNKLGVDVTALPRDDVSDGELGVFAADITAALPLSPILIDGKEVPLVTDPEFVFVDGDVSRTFDVDMPCDYFIETNYCKNEGTCVVVNGVPECRCSRAYSGPRCRENATLGLTNLEIGLIAGFAALLLLLTLLGLCMCVLMRNRRAQQPPADYFEDQQQPSVILANQPDYVYGGGYGGMYGGYK